MKSINDESFQTFGNIIDEDISDVIAYVATNVHPPKLGNRYYSSVPAVEQFSSVQKYGGYGRSYFWPYHVFYDILVAGHFYVRFSMFSRGLLLSVIVHPFITHLFV